MKRTYTYKTVISIVISGFLMLGCQSPAKLFEKQEYDASIQKAIKKIRKGKDIDTELRLVLEEAFLAATTRDMDRIAQLKISSKVNNWDLVYHLLERVEDRQDLVDRYLPIYDNHGYKADFQFVNTKLLKKEAATQASNKYYNLALEELVDAREGNKLAARQAVTLLSKIRKYDTSYRDSRSLRSEARDLGTTYVHFEVVQTARGRIPNSVRDDIERISFTVDSDDWLILDFKAKRDHYDYHIAYQIDDIDVSPDVYRESIIHEQKEVENKGYQIDSRGRYVLDSLGNKIEVLSVEVAKATVVKVYQFKEAIILGDLIITDLSSRRILDRDPVRAVSVFEKESCTYRGDERALSGNLPDFGPPVPYPRDEEMLVDVIKQLEKAFSKRLRGLDLI